MRLKAVDQAFAIIDNASSAPQVRWGALQVLHSIHDAKVTNGLIQRLRDDQPVARRQDIVSALSRLSNTETAWNGTWWATRPQNVGPYFAPTSWAETAKIQAALNTVLDRAGPEEVLAMGRTFQKEGVSAGPAVAKFLTYADSEPALIPQITSYFAGADTIPANAIPVLSKVASAPGTAAAVREVVERAFPSEQKYWGGAPFIATYIYDVTQSDLRRFAPWACGAIALLVLGLNLVGDGLRERLSPRG